MPANNGEWEGPEVWDEDEQAWVRYRIFGQARVRVTRYRKPGQTQRRTRSQEEEED